MNTVMTREELEQVLDQALQDVTEQTAGVRLHQGEQPLGEDLCTVHITFDKGFGTSLTLCADTSLLVRMAANSFHEDAVTQEDLEEFCKEYFNVLCGHIATGIFRATKVAPRFSTPTFFHGCYTPDGHATHFILNYTSDEQENVQLTHHMPTGVVQ